MFQREKSKILSPFNLLSVVCHISLSVYCRISIGYPTQVSTHLTAGSSRNKTNTSFSTNNMFRLVLYCECSLLVALPTFLYPAFQPLSHPNYTGLFEHPLPTTNPHNHRDCQYRTKTPCYYNPR